jgi:hypothetical protein
MLAIRRYKTDYLPAISLIGLARYALQDLPSFFFPEFSP